VLDLFNKLTLKDRYKVSLDNKNKLRTDRQTNIQTNIQTDRQTDRQTEIHNTHTNETNGRTQKTTTTTTTTILLFTAHPTIQNQAVSEKLLLPLKKRTKISKFCKFEKIPLGIRKDTAL